ncbi:hypothetical protein B0T25DRAFT_248461 [Lasiosphaeria hispida]|uniref:Uncharacterized protein n=1 Tax=Lasiosphaeria hispida TaxID=260671 RepID=A0AAJ0HF70_9PEZI|nr:hypothetical protein B0T25DRAFT_248461 [Lasiosphaeria hispida]
MPIMDDGAAAFASESQCASVTRSVSSSSPTRCDHSSEPCSEIRGRRASRLKTSSLCTPSSSSCAALQQWHGAILAHPLTGNPQEIFCRLLLERTKATRLAGSGIGIFRSYFRIVHHLLIRGWTPPQPLETCIQRQDLELLRGDGYKPPMFSLHEASDNVVLARQYFLSLARQTRGRVFAILESGLVGFVPGVARKGVEVVVLRGGKTPFLARPCSTEAHWEFMGDCTADGIMKGERMKMARSMGIVQYKLV